MGAEGTVLAESWGLRVRMVRIVVHKVRILVQELRRVQSRSVLSITVPIPVHFLTHFPCGPYADRTRTVRDAIDTRVADRYKRKRTQYANRREPNRAHIAVGARSGAVEDATERNAPLTVRNARGSGGNREPLARSNVNQRRLRAIY